MKELDFINQELVEIFEREAQRMFRLHWRAKAHGCSKELEEDILGEARIIHTYAHMPARVLELYNNCTFKYAFH